MADKLFRLEIIKPDGIFYEGEVRMVEYNTTEGEVGVYADHIPMTQIIAPGVLIITEAENEKKAALSAGFVEVEADKVTMLAESVEWPQDIDINRAKEAETRARRRIDTSKDGMDIARAELALKRALLRQEVAKY